MDVVSPFAAAGGYEPDVVICADDVPQGRPFPWMLFRAAERMGVFPPSALVAVDDTPVGIEAGLNAGVWTVAVTQTGNAFGLSPEELKQLPAAELRARHATAEAEFRKLGAHFVIDSVANLLQVIDEISQSPQL
jgi:phosphonoacetaldehyde hydrolase